MNILITNDDGIKREGILALAHALKKIPDAKLYVFAPDSERTAASMALTVREPLRLSSFDASAFGAEMAFGCSGTPVDCVRLAWHYLKERGIEIDLLCSGINHGTNIGGDVYFSGTVGAARQGVMRGIPSIAFSLEHHGCSHFELFDRLVPGIIEKTFGRIPAGTLLNVNAPDLPEEEVKGVRVASLGRYRLIERYVPRADEPNIFDLAADYDSCENLAGPESDTSLIEEGWITVTPLVVNYVPSEAFALAESWDLRF
jgi:5'-nucleotidase